MQFGARLSGRLAGMDVGLMNIQVGEQGDTPANNWSVVRLRQNILSNSDIGAFVFNRDSAAAGTGIAQPASTTPSGSCSGGLRLPALR